MYVVFAAATLLAADPAGDFYHPHFQPPVGPRHLDMSTAKPLEERAAPEPGLRFEDLDSVMADAPLTVPDQRIRADVSLPPEWT